MKDENYIFPMGGDQSLNTYYKSQGEMMEALKKRFKNSEILDGFEYSDEYSKTSCIWFRNASEITYTEKDLNPISALDNGIRSSKLYDLDVYHKFEKWCNKRGWYPSTEDYTLILFQI